MGILDINAIGAVLKQKYMKKVQNLGYGAGPFYGMLRKTTDFDGENLVVATRFARPNGRSHDSSRAEANISASAYQRFTCTRARDYGAFGLSTEAIRAAKSDAGAMIRALEPEIDGAIETLTSNAAVELFRNGGAARARGSTTSTVTNTLTNASDTAQFEYGMVVRSSSTDGTSGSVNAGSVTLIGIDRDAGTLTANVAWSTGITSYAQTDYVFVDGDFGAGIKGLLAWLPTTAPTVGESFFGADRSKDATRLGGVRISGGGGPIEGTLIEAKARLKREKSNPDTVFLNPIDYAQFEKAIAGKSLYDRGSRSSTDDPTIGWKSIQMAGGIDVIEDTNCPKGFGFMLMMETWSFRMLGKLGIIDDGDGLTLRKAAGDTWVGNTGYFGNLVCDAPGWNAVITL